MHELVVDIGDGRGTPEHLTKLDDLCHAIEETALCGLGKSATNPVLSTLGYFRDEYEAHVDDKKCRVKIFKPLIQYVIDVDKCTGW